MRSLCITGSMKQITRTLVLILAFSFFNSLTHAAETNESALKNESSAGLVLTGGNTKTQSISLKDQTSYTFEKNVFKFSGAFLRASNADIESAYNWNLGLRYERELTDTVSIYLGQNVESDKFQNILQRYNTDIGGKYFFNKEESFKWFGEAGYRFTRTNYTTSFKNDNYLRVYTEAERAFNKEVSAKFWLEYLPNITVSEAYKINSELSLSAALSNVFSVKSGYLVRYDNQPITGVTFKTDSTFTTALVAKF